jgi:hypothetical protein
VRACARAHTRTQRRTHTHHLQIETQNFCRCVQDSANGESGRAGGREGGRDSRIGGTTISTRSRCEILGTVCVCVCVCARARARASERASECACVLTSDYVFQSSVPLPFSLPLSPFLLLFAPMALVRPGRPAENRAVCSELTVFFTDRVIESWTCNTLACRQGVVFLGLRGEGRQVVCLREIDAPYCPSSRRP